MPDLEFEVSAETIEAILDSFLEHTYGSFESEVLKKAGMPSRKVYAERILSDPTFIEMIIETVKCNIYGYTDYDIYDDLSESGYEAFIKDDADRCEVIHKEILKERKELEEKKRKEDLEKAQANSLKKQLAASLKLLKDNGYTVAKAKVNPEVKSQ